MTCPSCGAEAPDGARFCPSCGHVLHRMADERRIVTVVFADLVGFTGMSESKDPEQVKNLVERCFDRLGADITSYGGRVDKIVGDEIIAMFGAPVAHEDDAERAVRAALQMQRTVAAYSADVGVDLRVRVGVNTGEVLVGAVRVAEYTAMGDVVNVGSRLRALAEPGAVVVGPETYAATRDVFVYEPLGALRARGREESVDAWRALAALMTPGQRPRRNAMTQLVGRDEELQVLKDTLSSSVSRRRAQLILLLGEAGLGKSLLAETLAGHAVREYGAMVLEGRCVPYGEANPWWPIAEALRRACGIEPTDSAELSLEKCRATVSRVTGHAVTSPDVGRIADGLLHLMGDEGRLSQVEPARALEEARRALRTLLEGMARDRPVLLVLSELHWADDVVLEQVARLDRVRDLPVIIVATARPELAERWQPPIGKHSVLVLQLDGLSPAEAARFLDSVLPEDAPTALRSAILDRAGGNPLFLSELVSLVEDCGCDSVEGLQLPATLRGLLASRLDGLTPRERSMLEDAAVIGRTGGRDVLLALAEQRGEIDARGLFDSLVAKDTLSLRTGDWEFRSTLLQEVAYETLTKAERARRHARLATWLSDHLRKLDREDEGLEQLAHHYAAAARLVAELGPVDGVPPDITELALKSLERAGARADQRELHAVSHHLLDHALEIVPADDIDTRRRILLNRASARAAQRDLVGARSDIDEVVATGDSEPADVARALTILGDIEQKESKFDEAIVTLDRAVAAWRKLGDRKGEARALQVRGMTSLVQGRPIDSKVDFEDALLAFREVGDARGEAWALQQLAWATFASGRPEDAEALLDDASRLFTEIGDWGGLAWVFGLLGWVRFTQGQLDEAEALARQVMEGDRDRGDPWAFAIMQLLLGSILLWRGQTADAIPLASEARETFRQIHDAVFELRSLGPLSRGLVARGRFGEAATLLEEAFARAERSGLLDAPVFTALVEGNAAVLMGDGPRALVAAKRATETIGPLEDAKGAMAGDERVALLGAALLMAGDIEGALEHLEESAGAASDGPKSNATAWLGLARAASGDAGGAREAAKRVAEADRATYMDRALARLAAGFAAVQDGDADDAERCFGEAVSEVDATGDLVAQAVTRLGQATGLAAMESAESEHPMVSARQRFSELGIAAEGWTTVFRMAVRRPA